MASSQIAISNQALAHIGVTTSIASLTESSKEARICALFFEPVRDTLLEAFDWGFARKRVALALSTAEVTNWEFAYAYPSDCVAARRLALAGQRNPRADQRLPFELASDGAVRLLLADQEDAELVYTARITDANLFSPGFVELMGYALAAKIAMPMAVSTSIANMARQAAADAFNAAVARDLNQGQEDQPVACEFLTVRE